MDEIMRFGCLAGLAIMFAFGYAIGKNNALLDVWNSFRHLPEYIAKSEALSMVSELLHR